MAPSFADLIQSPQFTFIVGKEAKPIVVHSAAIAATSAQLEALMNGGMAESVSRIAKLPDVRVDDFVRFCEYAYRGDYTVPPSTSIFHTTTSTTSLFGQQRTQATTSGRQRNSDTQPSVAPSLFGTPATYSSSRSGQPHSNLFSFASAQRNDSTLTAAAPLLFASVLSPNLGPAASPALKTIFGKANIQAKFLARQYIQSSGLKAQILQDFEPRIHSPLSNDPSQALLAHARLYAFAHARLIAPLEMLALSKLHRTLAAYMPYAGAIELALIELARFAYSCPDLPDRSEDGVLDSLRQMVVEYMVCAIDTIGQKEPFLAIMEEGGEFVADFWKLTRDCIS